jgi:predicted RNA-binding Zn-ribbon protein involved in translation (DUF1610 family)
MAKMMNCPGCSSPLRLRDGMAGRTIKCPRCARTIAIPAEGVMMVGQASAAAATPAESPASLPGDRDFRTRPCPECGEILDATAKKCRSCKTPLYKSCPRCGEEGAKRVAWTPWGSYYGPALFAHVRCPVCGYAYNGRSGRSNLVPAAIFVTVPLLLILAILGVLGWIIYHRAYM